MYLLFPYLAIFMILEYIGVSKMECLKRRLYVKEYVNVH